MNTEKQGSIKSMESGKKVFSSSQKPKQTVWYLPMDSEKWKITEITSKGAVVNSENG